VKYIARVHVPSDDRPRRVGGSGDGALAYACARARGVKRGEGAVANSDAYGDQWSTTKIK
jgi:hypothetical protein